MARAETSAHVRSRSACSSRHPARETRVRIDGLYNRQPARPTGRLILTALAGLQLIPATATSSAQITRPSPVQARLLDLLGVDPIRPP